MRKKIILSAAALISLGFTTLTGVALATSAVSSATPSPASHSSHSSHSSSSHSSPASPSTGSTTNCTVTYKVSGDLATANLASNCGSDTYYFASYSAKSSTKQTSFPQTLFKVATRTVGKPFTVALPPASCYQIDLSVENQFPTSLSSDRAHIPGYVSGSGQLGCTPPQATTTTTVARTTTTTVAPTTTTTVARTTTTTVAPTTTTVAPTTTTTVAPIHNYVNYCAYSGCYSWCPYEVSYTETYSPSSGGSMTLTLGTDCNRYQYSVVVYKAPACQAHNSVANYPQNLFSQATAPVGSNTITVSLPAGCYQIDLTDTSHTSFPGHLDSSYASPNQTSFIGGWIWGDVGGPGAA